MIQRLIDLLVGLWGLFFGSKKEDRKGSGKRIRCITLKLEGLNNTSVQWAAKRWTNVGGTTFVRACYLTDQFMSSERALKEAHRGFNRLKHKRIMRLSFEVSIANSPETEDCLVDDAVDCYTPQVLITHRQVRPLNDGEVHMDEDHRYGTLV